MEKTKKPKMAREQVMYHPNAQTIPNSYFTKFNMTTKTTHIDEVKSNAASVVFDIDTSILIPHMLSPKQYTK